MTTTALAPVNDIAMQLGFPLEAIDELIRIPGVQSILMVHGEKDREVAGLRNHIDALQAKIDANFREIQNQSRFARAWASVNGHNKQLTKDSEAKVREIQQTAVLMTQAMIERNDASQRLSATLLLDTFARQVSVAREQNDVREEMTEVARAATGNDAAFRALRGDHDALRADHEALGANVQHLQENPTASSLKTTGARPKATATKPSATDAKPKAPRSHGRRASMTKVPKRAGGSR